MKNVSSNSTDEKTDYSNAFSDPTVLVASKPIDKTPFWINKCPDGYFISMKNAKLTDFFKTEEEAEKWTHIKTWDLITKVAWLIAESVVELSKVEKSNNSVKD